MTTQERKGTKRRWWIAGGVVVILAAIGAGLFFSTRSTSARTAAVATTPVTRSTVVSTVTGSGTVAAAQSLDLNFKTSGTVTEVLVKEGDTVKAGQVLAKIDARALQSKVDSAQASLNSAKAQLAQKQEGNSTPEDIAAQKAQVANAQANLQKTRQGTYTAADVADAQAQLRSAQAQLDALRNPTLGDLSTTQQKVAQQQANVQSTRDSKSAAKTAAEITLNKTGDALTKAQADYATAKSNWEYAQETGADPTSPKNASGGKNKLTDTQKQQYYSTFVQADATLRSAEQDVTNAQVALDQARQDEVTSIQTAESQLTDAQAQLAALQNPDKNQLTQKQAAVDQARANLAKVQQGATKADIAASQASVAQAQANLDKLTAPSTQSDLDIQQAAIDQAQQNLTQAQLDLEQATLTAPFAGVLTTINIVLGSGSSGNSASDSTTTTAAMTLVNRDPLHVDLTLSENDVAKVALGQKVDLTIDALSDWKQQGTVSYIASTGSTSNDVVTFKVRVDFPGNDDKVKVGMTANLAITTATKANVLVVPNSALQPSGANQVVLVPNADGTSKQIEVKTGLTDGTQTEILSGLTEGMQIETTPGSTTTQRRGLFGPP